MNDKTAQDEFRHFVEDLRSTHGDKGLLAKMANQGFDTTKIIKTPTLAVDVSGLTLSYPGASKTLGGEERR